jgi:hypothetical protein
MSSDEDPWADLREAVRVAVDALVEVGGQLPAAPDPTPPGAGKSLTVKMDNDAGIELAVGRPLFPVVLLRLMGSLIGEDTNWGTADDDILKNEPLLVFLWKGATEEDQDKDAYLNDPGIAQAAALLAEATFGYLRDDGPINDWWEAAGGGDAVITTALAHGICDANEAAALARGIREANKAAIIGHLVSGALVNYLQGETGEDIPIPKVETEALWRARAAGGVI